VRTTLGPIKDASLCFRRFRNQKGEHPDERTKQAKIAERVIQKSYARATETGFKPDWRTVLGWVDREVFQDIDVDDTEGWKAGKICSEQVLNFLNSWYRQTLLHDQSLAYPGLTLFAQVSSTVIESTIPVIKVSEPPVIVSVSSVVQSGWQLYNDIEVRGQMWLLARELEVDSVCYQRLTIGPRGGIKDDVIFSGSEELDRAERMLRQVVRAIEQGADYPIISDRCNTCPYRRRCII